MVFCFHQIRADGHVSDALFHQQQALLRTLSSPTAIMTDSVKLWWYWRGNANRNLVRSSTLFLFALLFAVATITTSIFSSLIVTSTDVDVLVSSPSCGSANFSYGAVSLVAKLETSADQYAQQCYGNNNNTPSNCNIFTNPRVHYSTKRVPCPFKAVCEIPDAIQLDSGLLDVGQTFGLNMPNSERVRYRSTYTCSVLSSANYTQILPASKFSQLSWRPTLPGEELLFFNYGPAPGLNATWGVFLYRTNTSGTFEVQM